MRREKDKDEKRKEWEKKRPFKNRDKSCRVAVGERRDRRREEAESFSSFSSFFSFFSFSLPWILSSWSTNCINIQKKR